MQEFYSPLTGLNDTWSRPYYRFRRLADGTPPTSPEWTSWTNIVTATASENNILLTINNGGSQGTVTLTSSSSGLIAFDGVGKQLVFTTSFLNNTALRDMYTVHVDFDAVQSFWSSGSRVYSPTNASGRETSPYLNIADCLTVSPDVVMVRSMNPSVVESVIISDATIASGSAISFVGYSYNAPHTSHASSQ